MAKLICTNPAWLVQPSETPEPTSPSVAPWELEAERDEALDNRDQAREALQRHGEWATRRIKEEREFWCDLARCYGEVLEQCERHEADAERLATANRELREEILRMKQAKFVGGIHGS